MRAFEKSDGWKLCYDLTIATYEATEKRLEQEPNEILERLNYCALRAVGRIAYGNGSGDRRMLSHAVFQALSWLFEYREDLEVAVDRRLIERAAAEKLDSLRGRATFYTHKLLPRPTPPAETA